MRFEWNQVKNRRNQMKHKVSFETARLVFEDPLHVSFQDRHEGGEERWNTLGMIEGIVLLVVAHTVLEENGEELIRIFSARKANRQEIKKYEQAHS